MIHIHVHACDHINVHIHVCDHVDVHVVFLVQSTCICIIIMCCMQPSQYDNYRILLTSSDTYTCNYVTVFCVPCTCMSVDCR